MILAMTNCPCLGVGHHGVPLHHSNEVSTRVITRTPDLLHNLLEGLTVSTPPSCIGGGNLHE
jgi:hypothetical protein